MTATRRGVNTASRQRCPVLTYHWACSTTLNKFRCFICRSVCCKETHTKWIHYHAVELGTNTKEPLHFMKPYSSSRQHLSIFAPSISICYMLQTPYNFKWCIRYRESEKYESSHYAPKCLCCQEYKLDNTCNEQLIRSTDNCNTNCIVSCFSSKIFYTDWLPHPCLPFWRSSGRVW